MWTKLLRRYRIPEATLAMPRVRIADLSTGRTANLLRFANGHSVFTRVRQGARLAMLLRGYGREHDRVPGIAAHSGGSTEIQVTGTGPSPMQIGQKRIAPFQVQLQSGNIALENWIQAALGNGVPYRDIVFQATVNGPVLYNLVDSFLTRVVLIGPTLLSTDVGKAPNGVALTMQPNGRQ